MTARYTYTLDLQDDESLIAEYEAIHQAIWPEVRQHLSTHGVSNLEIYRLGTRLFMIMEVDETRFDHPKMLIDEANNPTLQRWENWMWKFQKATPWTPKGEKWVLMKKIFSL
ncbi:MAG: L-rhamnose mutarotase [Gammaproteobacteria bacterium]|nr:L-rhamnose mutarotase [Gammaproteobacteria bacterium]